MTRPAEVAVPSEVGGGAAAELSTGQTRGQSRHPPDVRRQNNGTRCRTVSGGQEKFDGRCQKASLLEQLFGSSIDNASEPYATRRAVDVFKIVTAWQKYAGL